MSPENVESVVFQYAVLLASPAHVRKSNAQVILWALIIIISPHIMNWVTAEAFSSENEDRN